MVASSLVFKGGIFYVIYTHGKTVFTRNSVGDKKKEKYFLVYLQRLDAILYSSLGRISTKIEISMATKTISLYGNRGTTNRADEIVMFGRCTSIFFSSLRP